jgi:hypothetical protein
VYRKKQAPQSAEKARWRSVLPGPRGTFATLAVSAAMVGSLVGVAQAAHGGDIAAVAKHHHTHSNGLLALPDPHFGDGKVWSGTVLLKPIQ